MPPLVLVIEDDTMLADVLRMYLEKDGYRVTVAGDGLEGLTQALVSKPALVILDIMLPRIDGWEVVRQLREVSQIPVILLTARGEEQDKLKGFELGADDYLTKPFSMQEFLARIRAVLKRTQGAGNAPSAPTPAPVDGVLTFPTLTIDNRRHRVERSGKQVALTPKEFELLWYLASRTGTVVRREELLEKVWGYGLGEDDRTIHTHINRLRAKLEDQEYQYIHTVWGVGYKFEVART
ncbi:MAG: response regulator transcription factor [Mycobacterium leprae]